MDNIIISLSDRGQLTIPQKIREKIPVKHFVCFIEQGNVVFKPLQTREDFLSELEEAEKDWGKNGGLNLTEIKKKYRL